MDFDENGVKSLVRKMGMQSEISSLLEMGATYEKVAEVFHEVFQAKIHTSPRAIYSKFGIIARAYGLGYDKQFNSKQIADELGCSGTYVREVRKTVSRRLFKTETRHNELEILYHSNHRHSLQYQFARARHTKKGAIRREIYQRILDKIEPPVLEIT